MFGGGTIKYLKEIEFPIHNGVTKPVRGKLDDETVAIIKLYNNVQGNLTLVNEIVCHQIAKTLGLPVVPSGICIFDDETINENSYASSINYGPCFYSTYLEKATPLKQGIIDLILNKKDFYKLLLFDHIVYNKDRNLGNMLVTYNKGNIAMKLIDHSHVFKNETIWDARCFHQGINDLDIMDSDVLLSNEAMYTLFYQTFNFEPDELYSLIAMFQSKITDDLLQNTVTELPDEWGVSKRDLDALVSYILYRTDNIKQICDMICDYRKH